MFPDFSPAELPLAGKSGCLYAVDLCSRLKVTDLLVADCYFSAELAIKLGDGSYWSMNLRYIASDEYTSPTQLLHMRKHLEEETDLLFIWGLVLPDVKDEQEIFLNLKKIDPSEENWPDGLYLLRNGEFYKCCCPILRIDSLKNYFNMNFHMLENPGIYSLPGYSSQAGFGIGMNVVMLQDTDVQTPVIILDNAYLGRGSALRDGMIVGSNVAIDEQTELCHSIIMDNTYIGRDMAFENKIVNGNRVLDPETDSYIDLEDNFLAGDFQNPQGNQFFILTEQLIAFILAIIELPLYLIARIFRKWIKNVPFPKFLLESYWKYWKVTAGRAQLVRFGKKQDEYVFRFSDLWWPMHSSKSEKDLDDVYFYHHRNLFWVIAVVFAGQLKRMLVLTDPLKPHPSDKGKSDQ